MMPGKTAKCGNIHPTPDLLERMYSDEKKSITDISNELGMSWSTIRRRLICAGVRLRGRREGIVAVGHKIASKLIGRNRFINEEWREKIIESRRKNVYQWAKGVRINTSGYVEYTMGEHKGKTVHVVVMEKLIGRRMLPNEVVHHIDENKKNNDISNLELMTRSEHSKHHQEKRHGKHQQGNHRRQFGPRS